MGVSLEEVKKLTSEEIYQKLSEFFENLYKLNNANDMNYSEYKKIILDEIETSKEEYTGSVNYDTYIKKLVLKRIKTDSSYSISDSVNSYLRDIEKIKLYDKSIEEDLIIAAQNGDINARNMIMENYLRLVISISKRYLNKGLSIEDLIQEGTFGIISAINKYDSGKGTKFSTYAFTWIRQKMGRAIADKGKTIRIPVHLYEKVSMYNKTFSILEKELRRVPSEEEVAERMHLSKEMLAQLGSVNQKMTSLNDKIYEGEEVELSDIIPNNDIPVDVQAINNTKMEDIEDLLYSNGLTDREILIIKMRYGLDENSPKTLEEVGTMLGLTRERIRQLENRAMEKIRSSKIIYNYIDYMGSPQQAFKNIKKMNESLNNSKKEKKYHIKDELFYNEDTGEIEKNNIESIYTIFHNFSHCKVDIAISKLNVFDQFLIYFRFGGNLEDPCIFEITNNQRKYFDEVIIPSIRKILFSLKAGEEKRIINNEVLSSNTFTSSDYIKLQKMFYKYINSGISFYLSINQFFIKLLSEGYINNKHYSKDDILNILHLNSFEFDSFIKDENKINNNKEDNLNIRKILKRI